MNRSGPLHSTTEMRGKMNGVVCTEPVAQQVFTIDKHSSTVQLAVEEGQDAPSSTDAKYDPFAARDKSNAYSDLGALAHLLKSAMSSGFLVMPLAFKNSGLAFGLVATFVVGYVFNHTIQLLVKCAQELCRRTRVPVMTFAETAEAAFKTSRFELLRRYSTFARHFVNTGILLSYYGASSVYIVLLAKSLRQVCDYYVPEMAELDIRVYILMPLPILLVLGVLRELKYLVPFSLLANVAVGFSCAVTLYYMFSDIPDIADRKQFSTAGQLPLFFSIAIFSMECIGIVMPIENSMKKPQHFLGCPGVLNIGMGFVVTLYAVMGFFGYLKYGEDTQDSITLNLPVDEILAQSVNVAIAVATLVTFGLSVIIPNNTALALLSKKVSPKRHGLLQNLYRISSVLLTVAIAVAVPHLEPIVSLVGALFLSMLGLFCPPILETIVFWDDGLGWKRWRLWKNVIIAVFSWFGLVTGCYSSVLDIINTY